MNYCRPALLLLLVSFFSGNIYCQSFPGDIPFLPLPPARWNISLNPFGLLEPQSAIGLGIGYRLNKHIEIWSETSLLAGWTWWSADTGHLKGVRQILQLKYFLGHSGKFFIDGEIRYKSFSMNLSDDMVNGMTGNVLPNSPFRLRTYLFGAALQFGARLSLFRNNPHWWVEATAGIGVKQKTVILGYIPAGYKLVTSVDLNVFDLETTPGTMPYFPGSLRFIYMFGKKLH